MILERMQDCIVYTQHILQKTAKKYIVVVNFKQYLFWSLTSTVVVLDNIEY